MKEIYGSDIVTWAKAQVGGAYGYSEGRGPTYACNDFVITALRKAGLKVPYMQVEELCRSKYVRGIRAADARAGDIVVWRLNNGTDGPNDRDHIGLVLGGGNFVHASNSAPYPQGGIKVSNYRDGFYSGNSRAFFRAVGVVPPVQPIKAAPRPPTTPPPRGDLSLAKVRPGLRNKDVKRLQVALRAVNKAYRDLNPSGPTGYYGRQTKAMVALRQRELGFTGKAADGVLGQKSAKSLGFRAVK